MYGLSINLAIFLLGVFVSDFKFEQSANTLSAKSVQIELIGTIAEPPEEKAKSVQCLMKLDEVKEREMFVTCNDKVLLYLKKDSSALTLRSGDVIICKTSLSKIKSSGNPYEFDYNKYMSYQGVHFSGYVDAHSWKYLSSGNLFVLKKWAYSLRDKLLAIFPGLGMTGDELGVASALIVGDKTNLDNEIKRAYVASGTMHILAVSGMHVAILYWVLNMGLFFLNRIRHGKYLKLVILLSAVWMYAMLTGLSGSVLRAAAMITFVIIGESFSRKANIFNSLAASAFLLLLVNPFNLIDVGFQLSYMAVISIVVFYPLIYERIEIQNWLGDQLWSLTAVTLAAQIVTTPISLFYFHQFPNLFLVSNLIMIPLSTLIMYFAMVIMPFSGLDWVMGWMGKAFNFLVWLLNKVVLTIESLPYALTKGVFITWLDVCLLYLLVIFLTLYLVKKRSLYFVLGLGVVLVFISHGLVIKYQSFTTKEMIVYNDKDNVVLQFRDGATSIWMVNRKCEHVSKFIQISSDAMHCKNSQVVFLDSIRQKSGTGGLWLSNNLWVRGNFIQFFDKKIVISDGTEARKSSDKSIGVDYLLVRDTKPNTQAFLKDCYLAKTVVIAPVVFGYKAKKIEKSFVESKVILYDIENSGALRLKL